MSTMSKMWKNEERKVEEEHACVGMCACKHMNTHTQKNRTLTKYSNQSTF